MTKARLFLAGSLLLIGLGVLGVTVQAAWWSKSDKTVKGELLELTWENLIPADFEQPENPLMNMSQEEIDKLFDGSDESNALLASLEEKFYYAPTVPELDGKRVKIPAYITPLDFNGEMKMKEFLLVPYVGACIHTPPPPSNQIVLAQSPEAVKLGSTNKPVWAIGVMRTEKVETDLAEAGYRLEVEQILPYQVPQQHRLPVEQPPTH